MNPLPFRDVSFRFRNYKGIIESECFMICQDYWKAGFNKILVNPNVKVAYEYWYYYTCKYLDPIFKIHAYFYYYFAYFLENNPSAANLNDNNIPMQKDWRYFV